MNPEKDQPVPGAPDEQEKPENEEQKAPGPFESDTQKLVRRHMEDQDHQISDEDIANIRVGMEPPFPDEPTRARLESDDAIDDVEEKMLKDRHIEEDKNIKDDKITPWDIKEG